MRIRTQSFILSMLALCAAQLLPSVANAYQEVRGIGGMCLDVAGDGGRGSKVIMWPCHGGRNQQWSYNGREIKTHDNLCLDVSGNGGEGAQVIAWSCHHGRNQVWHAQRNGSLRSADGLCLDVAGGQAVKGAKVIVWRCHGGNNQRWR